jgi:hypothetical protein
VDKGNALCRRCLGKKKLAADLARPFPTLPMKREETRQAEEAVRADSSVLVRLCPHGFKDWSDCVTCVAAADWDDG